jgi:hypothetical protein
MMNFECHITIALEDAEIGAQIAGVLHWKTSEIARDPVLGKDSYFYLTTHSQTIQVMLTRMNAATGALRQAGVHVIREKIELIIHDIRF